jgi:hypothetical protein
MVSHAMLSIRYALPSGRVICPLVKKVSLLPLS